MSDWIGLTLGNWDGGKDTSELGVVVGFRSVGAVDTGEEVTGDTVIGDMDDVGDVVGDFDVGARVGDFDVGEMVGAFDVGDTVGDCDVGDTVGDFDVGDMVGDFDVGNDVAGSFVIGIGVGDDEGAKSG